MPKTMPLVLSYLDSSVGTYEVILVDDGSTDASSQLAKPFLRGDQVRLLIHPTNRGKGAAVRTGMLAARGKTVMFCDADLATPMDETTAFLEILERGDADVLIASRAVTGSQVEKSQSPLRVLVGKTGNFLVRQILGLPFHDTQCGFKMFTAEAARRLFQTQRFPRWSFDIEVLYRARLAGLRVRELPVKWHHVEGSSVRPLIDPLAVLKDVIIMKFTLHR